MKRYVSIEREESEQGETQVGLFVFSKNIPVFGKVLHVKWSYEDSLLVKLDQLIFDFENDIYLNCTYVHETEYFYSTRNVLETGNDSYEILTDKIAELSNLGDLIMMSDFNSRTGDLQDFYDFVKNNDEHEHMLEEECINVINKT